MEAREKRAFASQCLWRVCSFECFCECWSLTRPNPGKLGGFSIQRKKNPQFFLARAFGARDVFSVREAREHDHSRTSAFDVFSVFECFWEWRSLPRPNPGETKWFFDHVPGNTFKFFSLAPMALAMSSHLICFWEARKTTIREPERLAYFRFSNAVVNGDTYKAKPGVN